MVFGYLVNPRIFGRLPQSGMGKSRSINLYAGLLLIAGSASLSACTPAETAAAEDAAEAQALLEQRRIAEARLAIKSAIEIRDDEPAFHILRGRIEMAAKSTSGAFDAYNDARSLDPTNMEALQAVSQLGLQTGHFRQSIEATDAILALSPDEPGALLVRGLHAVVRRRFEEADGFADRILARNPNDEGGVILKARIAVRKGTPQEALDVLSAYGASKPNTVGVVMTRLEVYRAMRDAPGMRSQFALLRKLSPGDRELRIDEANFAFKTDRPADGHALVIALLADAGTSRDAVDALLALWREYGIAGVADARFAPIAETGAVATRRAVAEFLAWRGRLSASRAIVEGLAPGDRGAIDALLLLREGRGAQARRLSDRILKRDATHCLALTVRAEALLLARDPVEAQRSAQLAASQCPAQIEAWAALAEAYARRGDSDNARRVWRQGMSANPQNPEMAAAAIDWLTASGQERDALAFARRLTHRAPALLGGWRLYRTTCQRMDRTCIASAETGLRDAATIFAIDPPPGQALPNGLFGRIVLR